ncbi:MAG: lipoprotein signal peptidase [Muribaculaceae bacterium]|nr:lipoprotein signal peptidase [Muribaculaceae bacterium]
MKLSRGALALIIIAVVIVLDQALKIWVKTSFYWGESVSILPFFELRFVQNPGMAFGWQLGSKLFLTIFRILAVVALFFYIGKIRHLKLLPLGYLICVALVTAGAMGNIFDCVFYGEIFNNPYPPRVASFVPWGEGYAPLFHGMVVDMLYFPLFSFTWPDWMPWVGGTVFSFFDPVFNLADASISVAMIAIILFYHKYILVTSDEQIRSVTDTKDK